MFQACRRGARGEAQGGRRGARQSRASAHTPSIADGTAEMHRGRGGSRHFQRHRGFFPEGSLFVSLRATGYLLSIFLFCLPLSVRQKKCRNEETTARREVYRTPYWGKEKKSFGCKKYGKKRICYVLHISKNYCTLDGGFQCDFRSKTAKKFAQFKNF